MIEFHRKIYARCIRLMVEGVEASLQYEPVDAAIDGKFENFQGPYFYHYSQSDLESYATILLNLEILEPLTKPAYSAVSFRLLYSSKDVEGIAYSRAPSGPPFLEVLRALIYFAGDKRGMTNEIGVEFPGDCYTHSIMEDLCALGYAARTESGFVWVPKFSLLLDFSGGYGETL